jgi:hypothetical protein
MVSSVRTMHLSCVKISTISKRTEMSFCLSLITSEYHLVHLNWFLSLWYVRSKPCAYLASRLALSPNGPKRASTWASSSSNSIGCIQNDFLACGTFVNRCTYLAPTLTLSPNKPKWDLISIRCVQNNYWSYGMLNEFSFEPRHLGVPPSASKIISMPMVLWCKSCTDTDTVFKWTKIRFDMTHVT